MRVPMNASAMKALKQAANATGWQTADPAMDAMDLNSRFALCGLLLLLIASCAADASEGAAQRGFDDEVAVSTQPLQPTAAASVQNYQLFSDGWALQASAAAATLPANTVFAQTLSVAGSTGTRTIALAGGESARAIAALVNTQSANTGVTASARTLAVLAAANTGTFTFDLSGANLGAATIVVEITDLSDLRNVASAINASTAQTGITATAQGGTVTLTSQVGDDIGIANVTDGAAGALTVAAYDYDGAGGGFSPATVALTAGNGSTRLTGQLSFGSRRPFTISTDTAGSVFQTAVNQSSRTHH
jgi:hypothetical protein